MGRINSKARRFWWVVVVLVVLAGIVLWWRGREAADASLMIKAEVGSLRVTVDVTGELEAQTSTNIEAPADRMRSRNLHLGDITIQDLVPEGTIVEEGQVVARLDPSPLSSLIKTAQDEVETAQQKLIQAQLDTTLTLRDLRNAMVNMHFALEEQKIVVSQSQFEPPATQRKAQIDLEKAQRAIDQANVSNKLKEKQLTATVREAQLNLAKQQRSLNEMYELLELFTIRAPKRGMVIYYKEWNGEKRTVGSKVSPWESTIATLPDLSKMQSKCYVNEVDVSKVKPGLPVAITVDAFPDRHYTGQVASVANVGETVRGGTTKVFEVVIKLDAVDSLIRPAMTTRNEIILTTRDSVLACPLDCLQATDSATFVYTSDGRRQEVETGLTNATHAEIVRGLKPGQWLYLSMPPKPERFRWAPLPAKPEQPKANDGVRRQAGSR